MCDYSLTGLRTRLAVEGEELIIYRFPTGSIGLTSASEVAVHKKGISRFAALVRPARGSLRSMHSARCTLVAA